jgi:hypothetical protein
MHTNEYRKHDWDKMAQQTKTIYNNVLGEYAKKLLGPPIIQHS